MFELAQPTAQKLGAPDVVKRADVIANSDYVGDGYGLPTEAGSRQSACLRSSKASCWIRSIRPRALRG